MQAAGGRSARSCTLQRSNTAPLPNVVGLVSEVSPRPFFQFEPYLHVKSRAGKLGLVVPKELLLPEQKAPGSVTFRTDASSEHTVGFSEIFPDDSNNSLAYLKDILHQELLRKTLILDAKQLQKTQGGYSGAALLHDQVPASRWGITLASLEDFVTIVKNKWQRGDLHNTGGYDRAKFEDATMGPNIYQVCEQVIKKETNDLNPSLMLPGVSWALKSCLVGVKISVFVSHAWAEGIFELHRLLKQAWRNGGFRQNEGAYICCLSNPQNLDIRTLLTSIHTSPFNIALQNMPRNGKVIMIATQNAPIHMRLWCVFEAHIAMENGLAVTIAGDRANLAQDRDAFLEQESRVSNLSKVAQHAAIGFLFLNKWLRSGKLPESRDIDGAAELPENPGKGCGVVVSIGVILALEAVHDWRDDGKLCSDTIAWNACLIIPFWLLFACVYAAFFCGWVYVQWLAHKGSFLNVRDAQCSDPEDAERIRQVITGKEDAISAMIGNLIVNPTPRAPRPQSRLLRESRLLRGRSGYLQLDETL